MKCHISLDTTAQSVGSDEVYKKLRSLEKKYSFDTLSVSTRGLLSLEPFLEIENNNNLVGFRNVCESDVESILKSFNTNQTHQLCIGETHSYPIIKKQHRILFKNLGNNSPGSLDDYINLGGFSAYKNIINLSKEEIIKQIKDADIRGRGGAYFPAYIKWQTVLNESSQIKYVVCNADEGDSGSFADRLILENDPYSLVEAMLIAGYVIGAKEGYIYLRSEYPYAKKILESAISKAYEAGFLGKTSNFDFELHTVIGGGAYVCGEETSLIESLENKRGLVRPRPPVPAISGLFDKPTLLNNVLSFIDIVRLFEGSRDCHTTPIQLSGAILNGGIFEVKDNISIAGVLEEFGMTNPNKIKAVLIGGPLGGFIPRDKFDLKLDQEELLKEGFILGHASVVAFDHSVNMKDILLNLIEFFIHESCGKCTPCRIGQVRLKEIINSIDLKDNKKLELLEDLLDNMKEVSLCGLGGLAYLPVRSVMKYFSEDFGE